MTSVTEITVENKFYGEIWMNLWAFIREVVFDILEEKVTCQSIALGMSFFIFISRKRYGGNPTGFGLFLYIVRWKLSGKQPLWWYYLIYGSYCLSTSLTVLNFIKKSKKHFFINLEQCNEPIQL